MGHAHTRHSDTIPAARGSYQFLLTMGIALFLQPCLLLFQKIIVIKCIENS